ncbi:NACHT domain-containing protein [Tardiphaga sp. 804_B3_N1_9]|uniref:NACHT domain-containing protein n=1 Tax=Tardiphaga TaxID=1395974 RepID=UPI001586E5DF|nr:NACHT domain-containing protein [Tardiphaga robiniae]NUU42934.1 NACHT domain-containing protein [Tardiphaga robiniae]
MPEAGGPTAQSGILYQNSIAALYLGRLLDLRPTPSGKRISSIRLEAPEQVDDIVINYASGSRLLIQAKESISTSSTPWKQFWLDLKEQQLAIECRLDEYRLIVGTFSKEIDTLREACDRSQGKDNHSEWLDALNKDQKHIVDQIATTLASTVEVVFLTIRRLSIEFLPFSHIESTGIRDWIPDSSSSRETLFAILRDACGGAARVRGTFTARDFASKIFSIHDIKLLGSPGDGLANYLRSIGTQFNAITVPGTSLNSNEMELLVWPHVTSIARTIHTDFEEESPFTPRPTIDSFFDLKKFPHETASFGLIVAGAGFGKSTFLRAIARHLATNTSHVPAYITSDTLQNYQDLDQYLSTATNQHFRSQIDWAVLCEQGRAILLIDGLDELSDEGRSKVSTMIARAHAIYPSLPILVAARDSAVIALPTSFQYYRLERLDVQQLSELLKRYLSTRGNSDHSSLISQVIHKPELVALCSIPLFAAMLVATLPPNGNIPETRTELLERYLDIVLSPHRHKNTERPRLPLSTLRTGAELLARAGLDSNQISIPETRARDKLNTKFGDIRGDSCVEELLRCGLLVKRGFRVGFAIATVQEYLAACDLAKDQNPDPDAWFHSTTRRPWAQAVQFAIEKLTNVNDLLSRQLARPDDYYKTTTRLIARGIVNGAHVSQELRKSVASNLIRSWFSSTYEVNHSIGILINEGFSTPPSTELIEALNTKAAKRYGGMRILEKIDDADLILDCFKGLIDEADIRDLWHPVWLRASTRHAAEMISLLVERISRPNDDSFNVSVVADIMYRMRTAQDVDWASIAKSERHPLTIRAAAHFGAKNENSESGKKDIQELVRQARPQNLWKSFSEALLSTTWWREHVKGILATTRLKKTTSGELDCYLNIDPQKPAAQDFLRELKTLVSSGEMHATSRMAPLTILAANGDVEAGELATELLSSANDRAIFQWLEISAFLEDGLQAAGLRKLKERSMPKTNELRLLRDINNRITFAPSGPQRVLNGRGPFRTTSDRKASREVAMIWTLDVLERLPLEGVERAELIVASIENKYGVSSSVLISMLREYLDKAIAIDRENWSWIIGGIHALASQNERIGANILWSILNKGIDLPTWSILELIWAEEGPTCCDRLIEVFSRNEEKRWEILSLLEKAAPIHGLSVRVRGADLLVEGLDKLGK